jgi:hypothetical protein
MSMYLISVKYGHVYLTMDKKGALGTQDEKRPRNCYDVDDEMLIPWLKMD